MIKSIKPKKILIDISTFDIETDKKGKLLDIGFNHAGDYHVFKSWFDFLYYLYNQTNENKTPPSVLWAHNGGKFDAVSLLMEIYINNKHYDNFIKLYTASLSNGAILELNIQFENGESIKIRDSFRLFPMALDKVLKSFISESKNDVPAEYKSDMGEYKKLFKSEYYDYLRQDVDGLYKALYKFRQIVNDISPIGDLPLSLGSLALRVYKTSFLNHEINTPGSDHDEFLTRAYAGGRTEYYGNGIKSDDGIYHNCNYYDYNSFYASNMQGNKFPIGPAVRVKKIEYYNDGNIIPGAYEIEYKQTGGHIPLLRSELADGKRTKEHSWEGQGVYTTDEIEYLIKIGADIKVINGYIYPESDYIFDEYVNSFFNLRLKARAENNSALDLVCKLLLNNLYGKFAQKQEAEELRFLTDAEANKILDDIKNKTEKKILSLTPMDTKDIYDKKLLPFCAKIKTVVHHRHALIAALITAKCRVQITGLCEQYNKTLLYCDTDSIILQETVDNSLIDNNGLGKLKPEYLNIDMRIWGRKQYEIIGKTIKQKGVSVQNQTEFSEAMQSGTGIAVYYKAPTGIKKAVKKGMKNANEFADYDRFIVPDLSSKEKGLLK